MRDVSEIAEIVSQARGRAGLSQRSLARRAGTTQAAISRIERGLEEPGFERFEAIMRSMGWQPEIELKPLPAHRADRRRLLEERHRGAAERLAEGFAGAELSEALRSAVERQR